MPVGGLRPVIPPGRPEDPGDPRGGGERAAVLLLALAGGLGLLAAALFALSPLAPAAGDLDGIRQVILTDEEHLRPEPLERFLYVAGVLLLPFCLGAAYLLARRLERSPRGRRVIGRLAAPAAWAEAPLLLLLVAAAVLADEREVVRLLFPGGAIPLAAAVVLALGATAAARSRHREQWRLARRILLPGLAGLLLLGVLGFNVLDREHFRNVPVFWASFNAVFYSVVQVFFGKQLLVDFVNQYGLYPHFLEPVFRVAGLTVFSFTLAMGLLNCLAFACMYRFLSRESGDELLSFLGLATILFFGYFAGRVDQPDLYLQYHPLRILFPAVSLLAARAFSRRPSSRLCALLFALGAAAVLWNPDTGAVVLAAAFLLVAYDALLRRRPGELPARLLLGIAAAAAFVGCFAVLMRLRFGAFPDFSRLFLHAKAMYALGANMLPMPRFGLWVPVLALYAGGVLRSLAALAEGEDTPRARLLLYLSVLGLGLFTYYQGRSTLGNLTAAGYPAVLLAVLFAGELRGLAPRPAPAATRVLSVAVLALLCYSVPALAAVAPRWVRAIAAKVRVSRKPGDTEVLRDARFLQSYVRPGQEVVIMSYNSGLHHLLTRTTNPLDIPGDSELVYRRDHQRQYDYAMSGRGLFVVDKTTMSAKAIEEFRRFNPVMYENPFGTLLVFPARGGVSRGRTPAGRGAGR